MGMGAETTSQVQDVVVAGSQSSNFLLPKENSGKASRSPGELTMVGLCSGGARGWPNKEWRGYCPPRWTCQGTAPHTHTRTHAAGVKSNCTTDPSRPQLLQAHPSLLPMHSTAMRPIIVLEVMAVKINSTYKT